MSTREKWRRAVGLLLVVLILAVCATPQFRSFVTLPEHLRLPLGHAQELTVGFPLAPSVASNITGGLAVEAATLSPGRRLIDGAPLSVTALQMGQYTVEFKLFGLIPVRRMTVDVVPPIRLVPGGHSIGVQLRSRGVLIVGFASIKDQEGRTQQPAKEAGLQLGDAILRIGGTEVTGEEHAALLFENAGRNGKPVTLEIRRDGKNLSKEVTPVKEQDSSRWRVGLYIRDGASGVGTLTFYHPGSATYGALGHVIADGETSQAIEFSSGQISSAEVVKIQKGRRAVPGEKITNDLGPQNKLGSIEKNSRFGIFGKMNGPVRNPLYPSPLPIAMAGQVKEGAAEILTVVDGQRIERFQVEIVRLMSQPTAEGKNMIVKVTDPKLLERTGGIVQGMSGSPIIQEGRIVGAITHVFVNDPTRGYGVLIEWMLQEAGILKSKPTGVSLRKGQPSWGLTA